MKLPVLPLGLIAIALLIIQCDPAKKAMQNDSQDATLEAIEQKDMVMDMEPQQNMIVGSGNSGNEGNTGVAGVPIDRVKLKGSQRGILTWNAQIPADTSSSFGNNQQVQAQKIGNTLKLKYLYNGVTTDLLTDQIESGSVAQLGVFLNKFNNTEHLVLLYSKTNGSIKSMVYKLPLGQIMPFALPSEQTQSPIPYTELVDNQLNFYTDLNQHEPAKSFNCTGTQMVLNQ